MYPGNRGMERQIPRDGHNFRQVPQLGDLTLEGNNDLESMDLSLLKMEYPAYNKRLSSTLEGQ